MQLDVFCEAATQISVMHLKSTKHFIWFIYWSWVQIGALVISNYLDHPFEFHFDLNTNYFKVQLVPKHKY